MYLGTQHYWYRQSELAQPGSHDLLLCWRFGGYLVGRHLVVWEHIMNRELTEAKAKQASGMPQLIVVLIVGIYFGIVLTKSEVVRWQRVHDMFLFREPHMYLIIGLAIVVAMLGMALIKRFEIKDLSGNPITYKPKPFHTGVVLGGVCFGAGWAITGACPGPIYAQLGAGEWLAGVTLIGALLGTFAYALLKPRLPH